MTENAIGENGILSLFDALKANTSLKTLNLRSEFIFLRNMMTTMVIVIVNLRQPFKRNMLSCCPKSQSITSSSSGGTLMFFVIETQILHLTWVQKGAFFLPVLHRRIIPQTYSKTQTCFRADLQFTATQLTSFFIFRIF